MDTIETLRARLQAANRQVEELTRAKNAAERAGAAKTRFLAAASHDLRQPLQAALMFSFALASLPAASERHRALTGNIQQALESVQDMLTELLDVSRLDAGGVEVVPSAFCIGAVLAPLCEEFRIHSHNTAVTLRYVPSRATVYSDPRLLERILRNLMVTAQVPPCGTGGLTRDS
ncbi:MAG: HAMP domain-containing sensor histidine kinase, partial [Rhodospirillaceae bacterium]